MFTDCEACGGTGQIAIQFEDTYFPMATDCRHCSGTGLGQWIAGDQDDDGDTRPHDQPYDAFGGRAAA